MLHSLFPVHALIKTKAFQDNEPLVWVFFTPLLLVIQKALQESLLRGSCCCSDSYSLVLIQVDAVYDCSSLYQRNYRISGVYKLPPDEFLGSPDLEVRMLSTKKMCVGSLFRYNQELLLYHRDGKSTYWIQMPCMWNHHLYAGKLQGREEWTFKREDRKMVKDFFSHYF